MSTTRRTALLAGVAAIGGMGMGSTSGCSTTTPGTIDPALLDSINKVIATSCNAIGTASTIVALIGALVPGLTAAAATAAQIATIAEAFCAAVQKPAASGKYEAKAKDTAVEVHGWIIKDNKVTEF